MKGPRFAPWDNRRQSHPDDVATDNFTLAMKVKLRKARNKGRGGWNNKALCTAEHLSKLLREHVEKGDPVDVANFCMMLHQRGERIACGLQCAPLGATQEIEPRMLDDWHEDCGPVVWWTWHSAGGWLGEPSWIGSPNDSDWPGYHTHWTPHPKLPAALSERRT